eukprot:m.179951 g.179951  ORF g.179951 m.179951 type:complete len:55 (+) comp39237_c0_seq7:26-190(+)
MCLICLDHQLVSGTDVVENCELLAPNAQNAQRLEESMLEMSLLEGARPRILPPS